ncbi:MAG: hypothetical protein NZ703_08750, partial [Gemmataceae bacterium]|nr:hypothetical protein [Gemmataceae bacterium]
GWLARCFVRDAQLRQRIPSGQNADDRSRHLLWIGPQQPPGLDAGEDYLPVPASLMLDLGTPYLLGDAPGFSDWSAAVVRLSRRAMAAGALKILVLPQQILRDRAIPELLRQLPASHVVPVVCFRGQPGQTEPTAALREDAFHHWHHWQQATPSVQLHPPLFIPDADCYAPHNPEQAIQHVQKRLQDTLTPLLADPQQRQQGIAEEILARGELFRRTALSCFEELCHRTRPILQQLQHDLHKLLPELAFKMFGDDLHLGMIVRSQLRALWLHTTPLWCFPYRSILGLLIVTTNAWDRLIFALTGSLPSLALTTWQALRNLRMVSRQHLRQRLDFAAPLQDKARQVVTLYLEQIRRVVQAAQGSEHSPQQSVDQHVVVKIAGLDEFQQRCRHLLQHTVQAATARLWAPVVFATVATAVFLFLFSGPVIVIYRQYLETIIQVFHGEHVQWSDFPQPSFSVIVTSFILSVIPVAIIAMASLTWASRMHAVNQIVRKVREQLAHLIEQWQQQALLRWEVEEPQLQAVQYLLQLEGAAVQPAPPQTLASEQTDALLDGNTNLHP